WQAFGKNGGPFRPRMEVDEPDTGLRGDRVAPSRYRVRPSKPMAVVGAVFGVALLAYGVTQFVRAGQANSFLVLWVVFGIAIIGFNLWAAFGKKGSLYSLDRLSGSDDR
ncbi:MAG TPA: hypothetical protein VHN18_14140, partial [Micromonosporaceae bacterium]|nr:hypothetical protein [Micromonosporaceae bacterium]